MLRRVGNLSLDEGLAIRARGRVAYYPPQGRVQLVMEAIDPRYTMGQLAADRDRILRTLAAEALLDRNAKLPLPPVPLRVGLVTSAGSAAFHDFADELTRTPYAFEIVLCDARVQGADAEATLIAAVSEAVAAAVDAIAIVRGGGSRTDLVAFDSEKLARVVATAPVPVITGIGHEVDRSVVDEVAHSVCKTPTACAALLVDAVGSYVESLYKIGSGVRAATAHRLSAAERDLAASAARLRRATTGALALAGAAVAERARRVETSAGRSLAACERRMSAAESLINAIHPRRTLARGYSITRRLGGDLVRSPEGIGAGEELITELATGTLRSLVSDKETDE